MRTCIFIFPLLCAFSTNVAAVIPADLCQKIKNTSGAQAFAFAQQKLWQTEAIPTGEYEVQQGEQIKGNGELIVILKPGKQYFLKKTPDDQISVSLQEMKADCPQIRQYRVNWKFWAMNLDKSGPFNLELPLFIESPDEGPVMEAKFQVQGVLHAPSASWSFQQKEAQAFMQGNSRQFSFELKNDGDRQLILRDPQFLKTDLPATLAIAKNNCNGELAPNKTCTVTLENSVKKRLPEMMIAFDSNALGAKNIIFQLSQETKGEVRMSIRYE